MLKKMMQRTTLLALALLCLLCCFSCSHKAPAFGELDFTPVDLSAYEQTDEVTDLVKISVVGFGDIVIRLYPEVAPKTVKNFQNLVAQKFYDGLIFHRVVENFVIQTGSPTGDGVGGSAEKIKGEFKANGFENNLKHIKGTVSMARVGNDKNSASSQFFIVHKTSSNNSTSLNGKYASFGYVIEGMDVVDKIAKVPVRSEDESTPITPVVIESIRFIKPVK